MSNEIKQGDKVRVSKDAPRIYTPDWTKNMFNLVLKVTAVEDGNASVEFAKRTPYITVLTTIPCKYLVKVDAEAKEAKFKVGDVVRIKPIADKLHQGYQNGYAWLPERDKYLGCVASVKEIWCDGSIILSIMDNLMWEPIDLEPYVEPTEQTEAEKTFDDQIRDVLNGVEHQDYGHPIQASIINLDIEKVAKEYTEAMVAATREYGDALCKYGLSIRMVDDLYKRDLAKEVAVKVANKYNDSEQAAEYAVSVAKAVAEGLKRK